MGVAQAGIQFVQRPWHPGSQGLSVHHDRSADVKGTQSQLRLEFPDGGLVCQVAGSGMFLKGTKKESEEEGT